MRRNILMLSFILWLVTFAAYATNQASKKIDTLYITDFGLKPNSKINSVLPVRNAIKQIKPGIETVLIFPKGQYDFWPINDFEKDYFESNTSDINPKRLGILFENLKGVTLDGDGSSFVFHDRIQPITIEKSQNIFIKNLSIDWEFPLTAQAEILKVSDQFIDVYIDKSQYPFEIVDGKIIFAAEGWKGGISAVMELEKESNLIAYNTGDSPSALGHNWKNYIAEDLGAGKIKLKNNFSRKPKEGNILILRHNERDHALMFILESKGITLNNIYGYHCAGLGILSQYSENLNFQDIHIIPNKEKGRYFSGHDDGFHFSNCSGEIFVDNCSFEGLMDDPINVHGTYVKIIKKIGSKKLLCRFMEHMSVGMNWARKGEEVSFIDNTSMKTLSKAKVVDFHPLNNTDFELTLNSPIPENIKDGFGLENLRWTPSVKIQNSVFGGNRARGILVSTNKPILIKNNVFKSSGSAILIAGDVNSWYESGAVSDCLIEGNKFLSSSNNSIYQFTEAIISIYPEIPVLNSETPYYHSNIRIENNEFNAFDYPILFAQSVSGLIFKNNIINSNNDYKPFHKKKVNFLILASNKVEILNNKIDPNLLGQNIELKFMNSSDVKLQREIKIEN